MIRRLYLMFGVLGLALHMLAQNGCYEGFVQQGEMYLQVLKFDSARYSFQAAFHCPERGGGKDISVRDSLFLLVDKKVSWYINDQKVVAVWEEAVALEEKDSLELAEHKLLKLSSLLETINDKVTHTVTGEMIDTLANTIKKKKETVAQELKLEHEFDSLMQKGMELDSMGLDFYQQAFVYFKQAADLYVIEGRNTRRYEAILAQNRIRDRLDECLNTGDCFRKDNYTQTQLQLAKLDKIEFPGEEGSLAARNKVAIGLIPIDADLFDYSKIDTSGIGDLLISELNSKRRSLYEVSFFLTYPYPVVTLSNVLANRDSLVEFQTRINRRVKLKSRIGYGGSFAFNLSMGELFLGLKTELDYYKSQSIERDRLISGEESFFNTFATFKTSLGFDLGKRINPWYMIWGNFSRTAEFYQLIYQSTANSLGNPELRRSKALRTLVGYGIGIKRKIKKQNYLFLAVTYYQSDSKDDYLSSDSSFASVSLNAIDGKAFSDRLESTSLLGVGLINRWLTFRLGYSHRF